MKLDRFHVENFGTLHRWDSHGLAAHPLIVLQGDNESGKSTFLEFFTSILFGFSPAGRAEHPYAPWSGEVPQGSCGLLLADGRAVSVERRMLHAPEGRMLDPAGESVIGNHPLPFLGTMNRKLFRTFHAISGPGLGDLDDEAWETVQERLLGGSHLPWLRTAREACLRLDGRASELWRDQRRGRTRARRLSLELRRLRRGRAEAVARMRRLLQLRELGAGKAWHIRGTQDQLAEARGRLQRAERVLPVLRGLQEIEDLRRKANERLPQDDFPADARGQLAALRQAAGSRIAESEPLGFEIANHEQRTRLSPAELSILAAEQEVRALVGEAAVHHQDLVHLNDLDRARDAQEALLQERAAQLFSGPLDAKAREMLSRLGMAELAARVKAWEDSRRQPDLAQEEVRQAKEAVHGAELDFEAVPSVDTERRMRQRETALRELQAREDVLAALRKDIETAKAPAGRKPLIRKPARGKVRGAAMVLGGAVLLVTLISGSSTSWVAVAPVAAVLLGAGALALRKRPLAAAGTPDQERADTLAKECQKLRAGLELHEFETVVGHLEKAQQAIALVAARPELERRLVAARQRVEDCVKRVAAKAAERDRARGVVAEYFGAVPVAPQRLEMPGQDLYNDIEELRAVLREMTRLQGEREAVARRARERESRGSALAEKLEMVLPGAAMDAATLWHEKLQLALAARRRADESQRLLPVMRERLAALKTALQSGSDELLAFEQRLARLDAEGGRAEGGLRWLELARSWQADAERLEKALHERFPDWKERHEEARAAQSAGETLDLRTEQRLELGRSIEQLEQGLMKLNAELSEISAERARLDVRRGLADIDGAIAAVEDDLQRTLRRHDRIALLSAVVREADHRWRDRYQPSVVNTASAHLRALTDQRWDRLEVEQRDGRSRLLLKRHDNHHAVPLDSPLSTALRGQAWLVLRLALAEQLDGPEPLPLLLDDVLSDCDGPRLQQAAAVLAGLSARRQVIVLTSHPHVAEALRSAASATVLQMPAPVSVKSRRARGEHRPENRVDVRPENRTGTDGRPQPHAV